MTDVDELSFAAISATLKKTAALLRDADITFLLAGSLASWARGGPETRHDLDLLIRPSDVDTALNVLGENGYKTERPPEGWLVKAWDGDVLVDLIFAPKGLAVDDELIDRAETLSVLSIELPVMTLEDLLATKLMALTEHSLDFAGPLQIARALREQIAWDEVRERTRTSPFAVAFFVLLEELGIVSAPAAPAALRVASAPAHRAQ